MLKARTSLLPAVFLLSAAVLAAACSDDAGSGGTGTNPDGGPVCDTCANVYTNGGIVCGPGSSADAWRALSLCACQGSTCGSTCGGNFCNSLPASDTCGACLVQFCSAQTMTCAAN